MLNGKLDYSNVSTTMNQSFKTFLNLKKLPTFPVFKVKLKLFALRCISHRTWIRQIDFIAFRKKVFVFIFGQKNQFLKQLEQRSPKNKSRLKNWDNRSEEQKNKRTNIKRKRVPTKLSSYNQMELLCLGAKPTYHLSFEAIKLLWLLTNIALFILLAALQF